MLLIDGVKYQEWIPKTEDEFEQVVKEHAKDIFGEESEYFFIKHKLKSRAGKGSIPDGFAIVFGDQPQWHIVEIELSYHAYEHIAGQVSKFINGITNATTQKEIVDTLYNEINSDEFRKLRLRKAIGITDTHKFLTDLISKPAMLTVIIEKHTEEVSEALNMLAYPPQNKKVVEFQTFARERIGLSVHAHLFEPIYKRPEPLTGQSVTGTKDKERKQKQGKRVTLQDLVDAKLVNPGQKIFSNYKGKRYEVEITAAGKLRLLHDDTIWNSLSEAAQHIADTAINGWIWWHTLKDGQECLMDDIRKKLPNDK
jgi:hypothetical protein